MQAPSQCHQTDVILFGSKHVQFHDYTSPSLLQVTSVKYLGVLLDDSLSWNDHVEQLPIDQ